MSIIRPRAAHERYSVPLWVVIVLLVPGPVVFVLVDEFTARAGWVAIPVMLLLGFAIWYYIRREVRSTEGASPDGQALPCVDDHRHCQHPGG